MTAIILGVVTGFWLIRMLEVTDHYSRGDFNGREAILVSALVTAFYVVGFWVLTLIAP